MAHVSLYNKYRSRRFSDLVGQEAISRALQGAVASGRVSHAYLFSGSRGTGKTTTARLLAKALNCEQRAGGSAEPCDVCASCLAVASGTHLDLIEIDAASNRGIEDIRDLREKVRLAPSMGRYKVYILDEAHMLTVEAGNALLKTLEEPPPHAVFVLCTTDAQKLPLTIVARCQQFPFRRHAVSDIVARLSFIASAEGVAVEPAALELMARTAEGSLRDAIGYLDQLVPLSAGTVTLEEARSILGIADPLAVAQLFASVLSGDAHSALHSLSALYEGGVELRPLVRALMERCRDALVEAISTRDAAARARLSSMLDGLLKLDGEVRRHAEPRFLVEATLVRLAVEGVPATAPAAPAPAATAPAAAVSAAPAVAAPIPPVSAPHPPEGAPHPNTADGAGGQETPLREPPPTVIPEPSPAPPVHPVEPPAGLDEAWKRVLAELRPVVRGYFREARPEYDGDTLVLSFPYAFHHKSAAEHRAAVEPLVRAHFGDSTRLELVLVEAESSRRAEGAGRAALPENDPRVREALSTFEGSRVVQVRKIEESSQ